jgi:hypothetical protein
MQIKVDLHVHTRYSYDSIITLEDLVFYARKSGLGGVAVTDHDRVDGALKMAKKTDFTIIPGIEISSLNGHVVGLNLQEAIPKGLSVEETVERIHKAGGIAVACHPTALLKGSLGKHVNSDFDAIEVINSSALPFNYSVRKNQQIASRLGIARVAGTDAHYGPEIGCAYTRINAEMEIEAIIKAISKGLCEPFGKSIPAMLRMKREFLVLKRKFRQKWES